MYLSDGVVVRGLRLWKKWLPQLQTARGVCLKERNNKPRPV